jgi:hypothetical protein
MGYSCVSDFLLGYMQLPRKSNHMPTNSSRTSPDRSHLWMTS